MHQQASFLSLFHVGLHLPFCFLLPLPTHAHILPSFTPSFTTCPILCPKRTGWSCSFIGLTEPSSPRAWERWVKMPPIHHNSFWGSIYIFPPMSLTGPAPLTTALSFYLYFPHTPGSLSPYSHLTGLFIPVIQLSQRFNHSAWCPHVSGSRIFQPAFFNSHSVLTPEVIPGFPGGELTDHT